MENLSTLKIAKKVLLFAKNDNYIKKISNT